MKTAAPENKSLKTLKGQLFGAVSMMLVAAIALGTSTYAWFINNRTVEVEQMQLQVSTSTSLTVAIEKKGDSGTYTDYKNLLTNPDIITAAGWSDIFKNPLFPASADNDGVKAGTFFKSTNTVNGNLLTKFAPAIVGEGDVKKLPLSFLSSADLDIYFNAAAIENLVSHITTDKDGETLTGDALIAAQKQADEIKRALHIALVPYGNETVPIAKSPVIFQFDAGTGHFTGAIYNTDFSKVTAVNGESTGIPAAITTLQNESKGTYTGISALVTDTGDGKDFVSTVKTQQALVPGLTGANNANTRLATVSSDNVTVTKVGGTPIFTLDADKPTKVDVYIWLEGTDKDCISILSSYNFNLALPFAGIDKGTTATPTEEP